MTDCSTSDMKKTLGYFRDDSSWGRQPRKCLPSHERELYIEHLARSNLSKGYIRQKNRYIDEFLRYVHKEIGSTSLSKLNSEVVRKYVEITNSNKLILQTTRSTKSALVKQWLKWLHENNLIINDLSSLI